MPVSSSFGLSFPALVAMLHHLSGCDGANAGKLVHMAWVEAEAFTVEEVVENKGSELACINHCQATACGKSIHFDVDNQCCKLGTVTAMGPKGAKSTSAVRVIAAEEDIPTQRATHIYVTRNSAKKIDLTLSPTTSPPIEHPNFPAWDPNAVGFWYLGAGLICGGNLNDYCQYYSFNRGEAGSTTSQFSRIRRQPVAVMYQGRPWLVGGETNQGSGSTDTTDVLSEDGSTWNVGPTFPTVIVSACSAPLNDDGSKYMVVGGQTSDTNSDVTASAWIHDDANLGAWTSAPDMALARRYLACERVTLSDGRDVVVVAGGRKADASAAVEVEVYDITAGAWETGPDLPEARSLGALGNADERLFFVGGNGQNFYNDQFHNVLELKLDLSARDEVTEMEQGTNLQQQAVAFVY